MAPVLCHEQNALLPAGQARPRAREARHEETWGEHEKALGELGAVDLARRRRPSSARGGRGGVPAERMRRVAWAAAGGGGLLGWSVPSRAPAAGGRVHVTCRRSDRGKRPKKARKRSTALGAHPHQHCRCCPASGSRAACRVAVAGGRGSWERGDAAEHARQSLNAATVCASFLPGSWIVGSWR